MHYVLIYFLSILIAFSDTDNISMWENINNILRKQKIICIVVDMFSNRQIIYGRTFSIHLLHYHMSRTSTSWLLLWILLRHLKTKCLVLPDFVYHRIEKVFGYLNFKWRSWCVDDSNLLDDKHYQYNIGWHWVSIQPPAKINYTTPRNSCK